MVGEVETRLIEVLSAYAGADDAGWEAPTDDRLKGWFAAAFLEAIPPVQVNQVLVSVVPLRWAGGEGLVVEDARDSQLRGRLGDDVAVTVHIDRRSHLIIGLRFQPTKLSLDDPRLEHRPWTSQGAPAEVVEAAQRAADEFGLVGMVAASSDWVLAGGYLDLEAGVAISPESHLPAYSITKLFTTVALLRLVDRERIGLDDSANAHLDATLRLSSDAVTIRHLLSHTAGVRSDFEHYADAVPDQVSLLGPILTVDGEPAGRHEYSNGGFAALGRLIETVCGCPYTDVITAEVIGPLGLDNSSFPLTAPLAGYTAEGERAVRAPQQICTVPAAGGLWTTTSDLVRFGERWRTLIPEALAAEALTTQAPRGGSGGQGLGWLVQPPYVGHAGGGVGFSASLLVNLETATPVVTLLNRDVAAEPVNAALVAATDLGGTG